MWDMAEAMLKETLDEMNLEYVEAIGEAAFYGPKLDVQVKTALGHDETLSTVQLDYQAAENFDLTYIGEDGKNHRSEEHTSELQSRGHLVCRLLLEQKNTI